jgi:hypothetical protein
MPTTLMQVPIGRHQLEEDQEEPGDKLAEHILGLFRTFRWVCTGAGWTDEQFDETMANSENELRTKFGLLFSVYVTHARKA